MKWPADICAVAMCPGDENERYEEEETPNYIKSKFGACPWPYSQLKH